MRADSPSLLAAIARYFRRAEPESAFGCMTGWGSWTEEDRLRARSDGRDP